MPAPRAAVPAGTRRAPPAGADASRTFAAPRALIGPRAVSGIRGELLVMLDVLAGGREENERRRGSSRAESGTMVGPPVVTTPSERGLLCKLAGDWRTVVVFGMPNFCIDSKSPTYFRGEQKCELCEIENEFECQIMLTK